MFVVVVAAVEKKIDSIGTVAAEKKLEEEVGCRFTRRTETETLTHNAQHTHENKLTLSPK